MICLMSKPPFKKIAEIEFSAMSLGFALQFFKGFLWVTLYHDRLKIDEAMHHLYMRNQQSFTI